MTANKRDHRERAIDKINHEIKRKIGKIKKAARALGHLELAWFGYLLHIARISKLYPTDIAPSTRPEFVGIISSRIEDSTKYCIQSLIKHRSNVIYCDKSQAPAVRHNVAQLMLRLANELNALYEHLGLVSLLDVEVSGARDRYIAIHLEPSDPMATKTQKYFTRIDLDNEIRRSSLKSWQELLKSAEDRYRGYEDLFNTALGLGPLEYFGFYKVLIEIVIEGLTKMEASLPRLPNGNVDISTPDAPLYFFEATIYERAELNRRLTPAQQAVFKRLEVQPDNITDDQLRFFELTRTPIIPITDDVVMLMPELILDSLFLNIHYSLLESDDSVKEEYKDRASDDFLNEILNSARPFGFEEIDRNKDLFENKKKIGDIDIILHSHKSGQTLLVEAKNHSLPLDVYFKDFAATQQHLSRSKDWEKKVLKRLNYVRANTSALNLGTNYKYIIVSKEPEILSHDSSVLVLSIREFKHWLELGQPSDFAKFYDSAYESTQGLSSDELKTLESDGFLMQRMSTTNRKTNT